MSTYIIKYKDELQHFGVKGMRWGVRKASSKQSVKKNSNISSTAKKVAIGVAAAAAVAGVSYVAITRMNNKSAAAAKSTAMKFMRKYGAQKIKRGPTNTRWLPTENGTVQKSNYTRRLTGHSGRVTKLGAARHRHQFHTRKAQESPLSWDYMSGKTARGGHERRAYEAGNEIADIYKRSNNVKIYNSGKINKLRRQKGPKVLRYKP